MQFWKGWPVDTIDLFSREWADVPIENPLASPVQVAALASLPMPDQKPPRVIREGGYTMDANMLAFVAQARHYGHRHAALEPISIDVARRRIFDCLAVCEFARELLGEPHADMTPGNWARAIEAARKAGRRP